MSSRPSQRPSPPGTPTDAADERDVDDADGGPRGEDARTAFERILPELIRRGFEVGRGPLEKVSESIFPRELAAHLGAQLGDVRSTVVKAVAQEVGRFLRDADIASEIQKVMMGLRVEAKVQLRFDRREDGEVASKVDVQIEDASTERAERKKPR